MKKNNITQHFKPGGVITTSLVTPGTLDRNLIIAQGVVQTRSRIVQSVILANGDVTTRFGLEVSIVVCDGSVEVSGNVRQSIILARGEIKVGGSVVNSTLIAGGKVTLGKPVLGSPTQCEIRENTQMPLGFVKFFELSTVGVEVKAAKDVVQVSVIAKDKAFAKAGVQVGDIITEVNGKKPDSAEALRRLLRDALAVGDATLTVRRGDKTETVKVSLPD